MLKTIRLYTDYKFEGKIPYDNALAKALQWLYDDSNFEDDDSWGYSMNSRLPLYDVMTLVVLFVGGAHEEFGETKLHQIIHLLEEGKDQFNWRDVRPAVKYKDDIIQINKMESRTTEVLLWAAYVYCLLRCEEYNDSPDSKCHRAKDLLYRLLKQKSGLNDKAFQKHFLMRHQDSTMRILIENAFANRQKKAPVDNGLENKTTDDEIKAEVESLRGRVKELEKELAAAQAKAAELQQRLDDADGNSQEVEKWKQEAEREKKAREVMIVELLLPIFYNIEKDVQDFLEKVEGMDDLQITALVREWVKLKKISDQSKKRKLWSVLHAARLYRSTETNWNNQV